MTKSSEPESSIPLLHQSLCHWGRDVSCSTSALQRSPPCLTPVAGRRSNAKFSNPIDESADTTTINAAGPLLLKDDDTIIDELAKKTTTLSSSRKLQLDVGLAQIVVAADIVFAEPNSMLVAWVNHGLERAHARDSVSRKL